MTDEAETGTSGDGKKERNSWHRRAKKPPVNLWMLIRSRSASWDCKRVNAADAWTCERRAITQGKPQPQGQLSKHSTVGGDGYHTCTHILLNRKHTRTLLAVASRISSITVVKARAHTHLRCTRKSERSFVYFDRRTSADTFPARVYIKTHAEYISKCKSCLLNAVYRDCAHPHTQAAHILTAPSHLSQETPYPCRKRWVYPTQTVPRVPA